MKIIAVSKTFSMDKIEPLIKIGHNHFGENKVQEALDKWGEKKINYRNVQLHMVGRLQTNKVKLAVKLFDYIHSLDSIRLAEKISKEQNKNNKILKIFIQVNVGAEKQKGGIDIVEVSKFFKICKDQLNLNIIGLMCIPPLGGNKNTHFAKLRDLNSTLGLNELSMGMSSDYLDAIKYGSTYIRVGSAIFGERY